MQPPPPRKATNNTPQQRPRRRSHKRRHRKHRHRRLHLVPSKQVAHRPAANREEGRARQALEEAHDDHGLDVLRQGRGDEKDDECEEGAQVDGTAAVELGEGRPEGAHGYAEDEGGEADCGDVAGYVEFGVHLGVGCCVGG